MSNASNASTASTPDGGNDASSNTRRQRAHPASTSSSSADNNVDDDDGTDTTNETNANTNTNNGHVSSGRQRSLKERRASERFLAKLIEGYKNKFDDDDDEDHNGANSKEEDMMIVDDNPFRAARRRSSQESSGSDGVGNLNVRVLTEATVPVPASEMKMSEGRSVATQKEHKMCPEHLNCSTSDEGASSLLFSSHNNNDDDDDDDDNKNNDNNSNDDNNKGSPQNRGSASSSASSRSKRKHRSRSGDLNSIACPMTFHRRASSGGDRPRFLRSIIYADTAAAGAGAGAGAGAASSGIDITVDADVTSYMDLRRQTVIQPPLLSSNSMPNSSISTMRLRRRTTLSSSLPTNPQRNDSWTSYTLNAIHNHNLTNNNNGNSNDNNNNKQNQIVTQFIIPPYHLLRRRSSLANKTTQSACIVFLDLEGYSKNTDVTQRYVTCDFMNTLRNLLTFAYGKLPDRAIVEEYVVLPTGDGAAVCIMTPPKQEQQQQQQSNNEANVDLGGEEDGRNSICGENADVQQGDYCIEEEEDDMDESNGTHSSFSVFEFFEEMEGGPLVCNNHSQEMDEEDDFRSMCKCKRPKPTLQTIEETALWIGCSLLLWAKHRSIGLRVGLNSGELSIVQDPYRDPNVCGDAINMAARIMDTAMPGQVLVSSTTVAPKLELLQKQRKGEGSSEGNNGALITSSEGGDGEDAISLECRRPHMEYKLSSTPSEVVVKHGVTTLVQSVTATLYFFPTVKDLPLEARLELAALANNDDESKRDGSDENNGSDGDLDVDVAAILQKKMESRSSGDSSDRFDNNRTQSVKQLLQQEREQQEDNFGKQLQNLHMKPKPQAAALAANATPKTSPASTSTSSSTAEGTERSEKQQEDTTSSSLPLTLPQSYKPSRRQSNISTQQTPQKNKPAKHFRQTTPLELPCKPHHVGVHDTPVTKWYLKIKPDELKSDPESNQIKSKVLPTELIRRHRHIAFLGITHDNLSRTFLKVIIDDPHLTWERVYVFFPSDQCITHNLARNYPDWSVEELIQKKQFSQQSIQGILSPKVSDLRFLQYDNLMHCGSYWDWDEPGGFIHVSPLTWGQNPKTCPAMNYYWNSKVPSVEYRVYREGLEYLLGVARAFGGEKDDIILDIGDK